MKDLWIAQSGSTSTFAGVLNWGLRHVPRPWAGSMLETPAQGAPKVTFEWAH